MRKTTIAALTAALLIAAVICTAGCVSEDRIVGTYMTENDTAVIYAVFEKEGTGGFVGVTKEGGISDALGLSFNWKADGNNAYTLAFADGTAEAAVLDAKRGILTIGRVEYEKQTSAVGGATNLFVAGFMGAASIPLAQMEIMYSPGKASNAGGVPDSELEQVGGEVLAFVW